MKSDFIVGIDEVGRGALAGPVVVAAAAVSASLKLKVSAGGGSASGGESWKLRTLKDSKKLSAKQRERWFEYFKSCPEISYKVAFVYPRQIEKRNISGAANLAALRAYKRLAAPSEKGRSRIKVFLDGGLFLGARATQPSHAKTIIKADEKISAVAVASIIAKVIRDRAMVRLGKRYPAYGFEIHKGYGTLMHRRAIKKHGPSPVHRKTFLKA